MAYIGMHKFQQCLPSHRWSRLEGGSILLTGQAISALLKLHVLDLWNEVIISKPLHPLLAHVTQSLVPQLTGISGCSVHFLPTYSGMHQVQCVDIPSLGHNQVSFAELHDSVLDATGVALIIQPTG